MQDKSGSYQLYIDTGGTFTDCLAIAPTGEQQQVKVLSNSCLRGTVVRQMDNYSFVVQHHWPIQKEDVLIGYSFQVLQKEHPNITIVKHDTTAEIITVSQALLLEEGTPFEITAHEEAPILATRLITQTPLHQTLPPLEMRLGTTKGTNALLERKGAPIALFITKGFANLLDIGTQQRPDLFALEIKKPKQLYHTVIEVEERLNADGSVWIPLQTNPLDRQITQLEKQGIQTAAIALLHSYRNPQHEQQLANYLTKKGFTHLSLSSQLAPRIKILARTQTAVVNAYLSPIIEQYQHAVSSKLAENSSLHLMTSAGSLVKSNEFKAKDSLLSGPAGGIVGAVTIGKQAGFTQLISFDMGGTSTDVARYSGQYDYQLEQQVGDAHLFNPALAVETVAAGGGSICSFDGYKLKVGPESAGAFPGPACYGAGGPLTITDVNLLLGHIATHHFEIPIDVSAAEKRFIALLDEVNAKQTQEMGREELLVGLLQIANEKMADAIRRISVQKGYDPKHHALVAFGGAGGQHACGVAKQLGMMTILFPEKASLLSAYGIGQAAIERFAEAQILQPLTTYLPQLEQKIQELKQQAITLLAQEGIALQQITTQQPTIYLRLKGQDASLPIPYSQHLQADFQQQYQQLYGHWVKNQTIEIESIQVIANQRMTNDYKMIFPVETQCFASSSLPIHTEGMQGQGIKMQSIASLQYQQLKNQGFVKGPVLIVYPHSTLWVEKNWRVQINEENTAIVRFSPKTAFIHETEDAPMLEAIQLELFTNRFAAIAHEMGDMLQRTALSVNVKERLDFSCALLDADGQLVVNAPHIPVHLGSLGICVRRVLQEFPLNKGDVIITNHPAYGGSHLPDVTLITPVFTENEALIGYVANRAHHAEIGGSRPGSMPPHAQNLAEEGVVISPTYLLKNGVMNWAAVKQQLTQTRYPTRSLTENKADIQAALAANQRGVLALQQLVAIQGLDTVQKYMRLLRNYTAEQMRQVWKEMLGQHYQATEYLDDGTPISVHITVTTNELTFDFTGTGSVHTGNLNATSAIVHSAVMYVLRLLLAKPLPLNEGIMEKVRLILPNNCFLNPDFQQAPENCPAVVGGNTETSQRLVDTLIKALGMMAGSQGTMNNVLFGNDHFGYYETICGGSGAGNGFHGTDAVHIHMTNTRITDPEIMEHRYPVRLEQFAIRPNSGGKGKFNGGNGAIRSITFLAEMKLSILTQHRKEAPFGLAGGETGALGEQYILRQNGKQEQLKGMDACTVYAGDELVVLTPGGGGFGRASEYRTKVKM